MKEHGYQTEKIVHKIDDPVIYVIGEVETEYARGAELYAQKFHKNYSVQSIAARDSKIIVTLAERKLKNITWIGEEAVQESFCGRERFPR